MILLSICFTNTETAKYPGLNSAFDTTSGRGPWVYRLRIFGDPMPDPKRIPNEILDGIILKRMMSGGEIQVIVRDSYGEANEWLSSGCDGRYERPDIGYIERFVELNKKNHSIAYEIRGKDAVLRISPDELTTVLEGKDGVVEIPQYSHIGDPRYADEVVLNLFHRGYEYLTNERIHCDIVEKVIAYPMNHAIAVLVEKKIPREYPERPIPVYIGVDIGCPSGSYTLSRVDEKNPQIGEQLTLLF